MNIKKLRSALSEKQFRAELLQGLLDTAKRNGTTLTLSTAATYLSVAVGSVGIAAMGTAVGLPLAAILLPVSLLIGGFVDQDGFLSQTRNKVMDWIGGSDTPHEAEVIVTDALQLIGGRIDGVEDRLELAESRAEAISSELDILRERVINQGKWIMGIAVLAAGALGYAAFLAISTPK